jgi:hypothetical protein
MAEKFKIFPHFPFQGPPKYTPNVTFGMKIYHLATLAGANPTISRFTAITLSLWYILP